MTAADTIREVQIKVRSCPECGSRYGIDAAFCPFDGSPLATSTQPRARDPRANLIVDERYELLEPLGEGGMGIVYKVRHVTLERFFAMKVLRRDRAEDIDLASRFVREAKATAAIKHPAVVAITDFGVMADRVPYYVMELIEGGTLAASLRAHGPVPARHALRVARQIAEGLQASHDANVIHRDLKPENVFIVGSSGPTTGNDEIRIVDFGAAKIIGGSKLTRPGMVFGTPYYMSPEQASGSAPIDVRADVYSLGVLLYELVTGSVPFDADTYMGVLTKHMFQAPARPVAPVGTTLGELETIILRALEKNPEDRYASMTSFARALEQVEAGRRSDNPPRIDRPRQRGNDANEAMTTADCIELAVNKHVDDEARRQRRMLGAAVAIVCLSLSLLMAVFAFRPVGLHGADQTNVSVPTVAAKKLAPRVPTARALPLVAATAEASAESPPPVASTPQASPSEGTATSPAFAAPGSARPVRRAPPVPTAPRGRPTAESSDLPVSAPQRAEDFRDPWKR